MLTKTKQCFTPSIQIQILHSRYRTQNFRKKLCLRPSMGRKQSELKFNVRTHLSFFDVQIYSQMP